MKFDKCNVAMLVAGIAIGLTWHKILPITTSSQAALLAKDIPHEQVFKNVPSINTTLPFETPSSSLSSVKWIMGSPIDFATDYKKGCRGLSDKVDNAHKFHMMYQPQLSRYIREKVEKHSALSGDNGAVKFRMLEIGLGCAPGGGMIKGQPGGSAFAWRHLFNLIPNSTLQFELHVFEFDKDCANKWAQENTPHIAKMVHVGDASSEEDLERAYQESGGEPFDVIIDDASHINWHQIKTLDYMLPKVAKGGFFTVEDIQSACRGWRANMGSHRGENVGGANNCMTTVDGKPTILSHLVEYQRCLVGIRDYDRTDKKQFLKDVESIEIQSNIAVLKKKSAIIKS